MMLDKYWRNMIWLKANVDILYIKKINLNDF
jgi:hypothetical protein